MTRRAAILLALLLLTAAKRRDAVAPDFALPTTGGQVALSELRGKVVYVDFWASWCAPCRQSFPWMKSLSERFADRGLVVVAVNLDKDRAAAADFLARYPVPFAVAFDPSGKTAAAFHVQAMPSSFIVGRDGTIVAEHQGFEPATGRHVEEQLKEVLSQ